MTNPVFPILTKEQDSKYYTVTPEDVAMSSKMDGGYVVSRAKFTREPRLTIKTGYTSIGQADATLLLEFYKAVKGSTIIFDWTDPIGSTVLHVRFSGQLNFQYVGIGNTKLWDVTFSLEEA